MRLIPPFEMKTLGGDHAYTAFFSLGGAMSPQNMLVSHSSLVG